MLYNIPDEWKENLKVGHCWCSKPRSEFDKNQRVYCSEVHALEYSKRIQYWSVFRDHFIEKVGEVCQRCGMNNKKFNTREKKREREFYAKLVEDNKEAIEAERGKLLVELEQNYKNIMDDAYVLENMGYQTRQSFDLAFERFSNNYFVIEVDHIKAVALGGEMWDEDNLQALCNLRHKEKTKNDRKLIKQYKKANGNQELPTLQEKCE